MHGLPSNAQLELCGEILLHLLQSELDVLCEEIDSHNVCSTAGDDNISILLGLVG